MSDEAYREAYPSLLSLGKFIYTHLSILDTMFIQYVHQWCHNVLYVLFCDVHLHTPEYFRYKVYSIFS